jgi:competence protein ComGC
MNPIKNEKGFTLIEMMIVLLIISVLILIAIPNVTKHSQTIDKKGCEAYKTMVQGQVEAFKVETNQYPTDLKELSEGGSNYFSEEPVCPNGTKLTIVNGKVIEEPTE